MNIVLAIIELLLGFGGVLFFFYQKGKSGLLLWISLATMIAGIQATKLTFFGPLSFYMGNALYATTFLATDILNERYGQKAAMESIFYGIGGLACMSLFLYLTTLFTPAPGDTVQGSLQTVFSFELRIALASIMSFALSQLIDTLFFAKMKARDGSKKLWLRNNVSTIISQLADTVCFVLIGYSGTAGVSSLLVTAAILFGIKALCALLDTPFVYLARKIPTKEGDSVAPH